MDSLSISIIKTIAYFDIFDYPLTSWEIFVFLNSNSGYKYSEIIFGLLKIDLDSKLDSKNGFYFLSGREAIVKTRNSRCTHCMSLIHCVSVSGSCTVRRGVVEYSFVVSAVCGTCMHP